MTRKTAQTCPTLAETKCYHDDENINRCHGARFVALPLMRCLSVLAQTTDRKSVASDLPCPVTVKCVRYFHSVPFVLLLASASLHVLDRRWLVRSNAGLCNDL
jgi:hypothetical protein